MSNGSVKVLFKKSFQGNSSNLPNVGSPVPPELIVNNKDNWERLTKGMITDVQKKSSGLSIRVEFGTPTNILREIFLSEGWQEVPE